MLSIGRREKTDEMLLFQLLPARIIKLGMYLVFIQILMRLLTVMLLKLMLKNVATMKDLPLTVNMLNIG